MQAASKSLQTLIQSLIKDFSRPVSIREIKKVSTSGQILTLEVGAQRQTSTSSLHGILPSN
jgi:hypothetical protein